MCINYDFLLPISLKLSLETMFKCMILMNVEKRWYFVTVFLILDTHNLLICKLASSLYFEEIFFFCGPFTKKVLK